MAVRAEIAHAAVQFKMNAGMLAKALDGLTDEEWLRRPCETSNSVMWIVGHLVWARSRGARMLGSQWECEWVDCFERGSKAGETTNYPSVEAMKTAWQDVTAELTVGLERADEAVLEREAHRPSLNGKVSGMVDFLATHESYHVGQVGYLRCWLGKSGALG